METVVSFEDITFSVHKNNVRGTFLQHYYFTLLDKDLRLIAPYDVVGGALVFAEREKRVWNKFTKLLDQGLNRLMNKIHDKPCLYVHSGSGIPLIGSNEFGIVDRGSNILEVKPSTGCNLACTFCSVNEGVNNKTDVLVQEEYLINVFKQVASLKEHAVEANIGPQGEPLLYPQIVELVKDLKVAGASVVSINTNGTLLHKKLVDSLYDAGLDRINLSLHTLDQLQADNIMGGKQDIKRLLEIINYCAGKIDILLAPVLLPSVTDDQLDGLIKLAKNIKNKKWPAIGVQNFLSYPSGRNPGLVERSWDDFYTLLQQKEREFGINLTFNEELFNIYDEKQLLKPFKKHDVITVKIMAAGRNKHEWLGVAADRVVTIRNFKEGRIGLSCKVKLLRDKHNIFTGVVN